MPMNRHAEDIAQKRFRFGFELFEIQTAFNVLEEAIWKRMATLLEPKEFAGTMALVGTIWETARTLWHAPMSKWPVSTSVLYQ